MKKAKHIILGAGISPQDAPQYSLQKVTFNKRVLDWQKDAFKDVSPEVIFIGGYDIQNVINDFPDLTFHFNKKWDFSGSISSLRLAIESLKEDFDYDLYITYSDIIFENETISLLNSNSQSKIKFAVDNNIQSNDQLRKPVEKINVNGSEKLFVGLIYVNSNVVKDFYDFVLNQSQKLDKYHLSELFRLINNSNSFISEPVEISNKWAHAESSRSIAKFALGSKAKTLTRLKNKIQSAKILDLYFFTRAEFLKEKKSILKYIRSYFKESQELIIRSSAKDEDGFTYSNAGKYLSIQNVDKSSLKLEESINKVFQSYSQLFPDDEILIQPQLKEVKSSGVIFTRTLSIGAPYYIFNYTNSNDTTSITSGSNEKTIKYIICRGASQDSINNLPYNVRRLLKTVREIENLVSHDSLDIEFAYDTKDFLYILQVRPLIVKDSSLDKSSDPEVANTIKSISAYIKKLTRIEPRVLGEGSIWSVMADWNPAEIIGITPNPLAVDLYRRIITDKTWSQQRYEVGYRDLRGIPLLRCFGGQPFIDVKASINSFLPSDLDDTNATRIINYAIKKLKADNSLHDKVEFELIPTCIDFNFDNWEKEFLLNKVISKSSLSNYKKSLSKVTNNIIKKTSFELKKVELFAKELKKDKYREQPYSDWISSILDNCAVNGALPFAHLARAAFVAISLLNSSVSKGIFTSQRKNQLLENIEGLGNLLTVEAIKVREGKLSKEEFIAMFGHLRPGTYDISIPPYHSSIERYIDPIINSSQSLNSKEFKLDPNESSLLNKELNKLNITIDADEFIEFIKNAIYGREYSKFIFTKVISNVLDSLELKSKSLGISIEKMGFIPLNFWYDLSNQLWGEEYIKKLLIQNTNFRFKQFQLTKRLYFPSLITESTDIFAFQTPDIEPSFITNKVITANILIFSKELLFNKEIFKGKIIAIVNADPGFDYLFAIGISGLITSYGGPNSHMAIRASEFSIPAVIGIGNDKFESLINNALTTIDAETRRWFQEV